LLGQEQAFFGRFSDEGLPINAAGWNRLDESPHVLILAQVLSPLQILNAFLSAVNEIDPHADKIVGSASKLA
jgi:hypothetical protein